jgi:DNA-binding CsgD family transcriptional regulator/nucleoside 2-deoxyribosyltransferase
MPITTPLLYNQTYNNDKDHFPNVLQHLFTPAIDKAGFETISPKSTGSDLIHADIIKNLSDSDLVLCDMSILNPNVFFEFGIRCALNKPVALVIDDKTEKIPFDTGIINCHTYNSAPIWKVDKEIEDLSKHIKESFEKSKNNNALWKYFGIKQTGAFSPESATLDDKLDFIIQKLSEGKVLIDYKELAFSNLNRSEEKVLLLISEGKTNREIAKSLLLGEGTVRNYVSSILSKLGVNNRAEAAAYAIENSLRDHLSI